MRIEEIGRKISDGADISVARVSIGGEDPALVSGKEYRGCELLCPGGVLRLPKTGEEQLLIKTEDGSVLAAGVCDVEIPEGLSEGDILIKNGQASLCLRSDGSIEIYGKVLINGSELNGTEN